MTVASTILVVLTVLQMVGFGPSQLINRLTGISLPTTAVFNIAGSPFIAIQIIGLTLVGVIASIVKSKKISKFYAVSLPILIIGAAIYSFKELDNRLNLKELIIPYFSKNKNCNDNLNL